MSSWSEHSTWMSDMGFEDGWNAAMSEVSNVTRELLTAGQLELADRIHAEVWRRLLERQDAAMVERKARRAVRDQYVAEIAARKTAKAS